MGAIQRARLAEPHSSWLHAFLTIKTNVLYRKRQPAKFAAVLRCASLIRHALLET
ncbi:hypothetical protein ESA_03552 [Cronobacter sakazakii ATCC BAA-894]|uniref:Uncharacterized protein n=2 Tax=Cronobacter sakazakii TaxID=28141 RepID=A7MIN2_CROS8|nr:hypothetical protein ESA_03552 [Cronobacter sakazakii ATCC BAA-894]